MLRAAAVVLLAACLEACCSSYATRGCFTPDELRGLAVRGEFAPVREYLRDDRSWVREEAARTLGSYRVRDAREDLEAILRDKNERVWVRAAAAEALGLMRDPAAFPALAGIVGEPGLAPEVKIAAIVALCRAGGESVETTQTIAPLTGDEDLLVAAIAEESLATKCEEPKR